jgi:hypothetical protein
MYAKIAQLLIVFALFSTSTFAQVNKFSDKPETFLVEAKTLLNSTNNPKALQAGISLDAIWPKLNNEQQLTIINISKMMVAKGYKTFPHLSSFYETLSNAVTVRNLSASEMSRYLEVLQKTIETQDGKISARFIEMTRTFFSTGLIFNTSYNRLYLLNGKETIFTFKFNDQPTTIQAPAPETTKADKLIDDDGWGNNLNPAPTPTPEGWDNSPTTIGTTVAAGPVLEFVKANLVIVTASDSATLFATDGTLAIREGLIMGKYGRFTWEYAGLNDAYVMLGNYTMNLLRPTINSQDATLTFDSRLKESVKGIFEYQSKRRAKNQSNSYPRFFSASNNVTIKNLGADTEYHGGYSLVGSKTYTMALDGKQGIITIKHNGKVAFRAISRKFEITDSTIISPQSTITTYIDRDSITHTAIKLHFNRNTKFLKCNKLEKSGYKETPYSDSFHQMDIICDAFYYDLTKGKMDFYILSGKSVVPAIFESFDHFSPDRYASLVGQFGFHPLQVLYGYLQRNNKSSAMLAELATAFSRPIATIKDAMIAMTQQGFTNYNDIDEVVWFTRKGLHYVNSYNKRKDFDVLFIPSFYNNNVKENMGNATIDLKDKYLVIRGVKRLTLSDSLSARMNPGDGEIKMNRERNFTINGELRMSNFRFKGKNFYFSYKDFAVDLNKIDSITFVPQKLLAQKNYKEIGGDIRYKTGGKIYLSKPDNKSGRYSMPEYPRLVIPEGVTVYFDQPERDNKVYPRTVYFKIPTIDYDSLNKKDIDFVGTFYAGGMMPNFQDRLITMPDHTLGFRHKVPTGEYNVYGTNSSVKFKTELIMDKNGLHTEGETRHFTGAFPSKDILFMPDSLTASGIAAEIKESEATDKMYFPSVSMKNYSFRWFPKKDTMEIAAKGGTFDFYTGTTRLEGKLLLRSLGLFGIGKMKRADSETASERFKFNKNEFIAEQAQIKVGTNLVAYKPALLGREINLKFNIADGLAIIQLPKKTTDSAGLYFPYTSYRTNINRAEWNVTAKTILMKGDVSNSMFTSMEEKQEGLAFNGEEALYEIEKQTLNVRGVPFIKTADAKIVPDQGLVLIKRDAEMQPFKKAQIILDTITEYHRMANGNIQILSKREFEGDATYRYVNLLGDTTNIKMGDFDLKEAPATTKSKNAKNTFFTQAKATITEADQFMISPRMRYKGDITMVAYEKSLRLDGDIQLDLKKRPDLDNWIPYKGSSSQTVNIEVVPGMKADGKQLFAGLHYRTGTNGLYTTFLSPKEDDQDENIFVANGNLIDHAKESQYEVIGKEKASGKQYEGSRYVFDDKKGTVDFEGKFDFFQPSNYIQSGGKAHIHIDSSTYHFNQLMTINMPLPVQALTQMGEKIVKTNLDERNTDKAAEEDVEWLSVKMAQIVGDKPIQLFRDRTARGEHVPLHLVATKLNTSLVLSNVNLRWSDEYGTFYSVGKIGVSNIGQTDINTQMDAYLEIKKDPEGDEFLFYLEASPDVWYYFGFKDNQLGITSSESDFNAIIGIKAKPRSKAKSKDYSFFPADLDEKLLFVDRFTEMYKPSKKIERRIITPKREETLKEKKKDIVPVPEKEEKDNKKETNLNTPTTAPSKDPKKTTGSPSKVTKVEPVKKEEKKPEPKKVEEKKDGF